MDAQRKQLHVWGVHKRIAITLQAIIATGLIMEIYERQWLNVAIVSGILLLTIVPFFLARGLEVSIPPEFELLTIAFIFASIFLGESRGFYGRFWWWDIVLHTTSGGLLGILGFLLVYVLNANPRINLDLQPGFIAIFAFCFSVTIGVLWEIFEFFTDQVFGFNMQKPMLGDPSGLTDTMWDLIVNAVGAIVIAGLGYRLMKRGEKSTIDRWIDRFIENNPRLFKGSHRIVSEPDGQA